MKSPLIFQLGLAATLAFVLLQDALDGKPTLFSNGALALCALLGVLIQLSTLADHGASRLRLVSSLWMLLSIVLSSAFGTEFTMLVGLFFAGVVFSTMPTKSPAERSE